MLRWAICYTQINHRNVTKPIVGHRGVFYLNAVANRGLAFRDRIFRLCAYDFQNLPLLHITEWWFYLVIRTVDMATRHATMPQTGTGVLKFDSGTRQKDSWIGVGGPAVPTAATLKVGTGFCRPQLPTTTIPLFKQNILIVTWKYDIKVW